MKNRRKEEINLVIYSGVDFFNYALSIMNCKLCIIIMSQIFRIFVFFNM